MPEGSPALASTYASAAAIVGRPGEVTTWLNHWSLLHADWKALSKMGLVGFDGTLLQMVLRLNGINVRRSSGDLVIPVILSEVLPPDAKVALIGAVPGVAQKVADLFAPRPILAFNGYDELAELRKDPSPLIDFDPALVVLGLGAALQEQVAAEFAPLLPQAAIATCGGWLDQYAIAKGKYFPQWVYRCRLGWAVRIMREPRRLLARYTIEAVVFLLLVPPLMRRLRRLGAVEEWGIRTRASLKAHHSSSQ